MFHGVNAKSNVSPESEMRTASHHVVMLDQAFLPGDEGNDYLKNSSIDKFVLNKMRHIFNKSEELPHQPNPQENFPQKCWHPAPRCAYARNHSCHPTTHLGGYGAYSF